MAGFSGGGEAFPPLIGRSSTDYGYWVSIETVNYHQKATELPILMVKKFMEQYFVGTKVAKPTKEGRLILQASSKKVALQATKCKKFYEVCEINITPMESMNHKLGSIYGREMLTITVEEMEAELKNQHVTNVERAQTMRDGVLSPNGLHILTFDATKMPEDVYIGYMRYNVRTYYPRPLRCTRCCIFGNSKKRCTAEKEACRYCRETPHTGSSCVQKYCRNCEDESHGTFDKDCPKFELEVAIVRLKIDKNLSYGQARALLNKEIQRSTESYENSILEKLSKAARERAAEAAAEHAAIIQNEKEIEELKKELDKLRETTEMLEELKQKFMDLTRYLEESERNTQLTSPATTIEKNTASSSQKITQNTKKGQNKTTNEPTQMETETNLKRKKSKSKEEIPIKKYTTVINMHNFQSLTDEQLQQIQ
jgi:hypothetical protein